MKILNFVCQKIVRRIDGATLLFFLGILLAVDALRCGGVLTNFAFWLDETVGNVYAVNLIIGTLSAVVDNVPLVAGAIGMYPVATDAIIANSNRSDLYGKLLFKTEYSGNSWLIAPELEAAC